MKQDFREDFIFKKLQENYNVVDEAATLEQKSVFFNPEDVVVKTKNGIELNCEVLGEDNKPSYIRLYIDNKFLEPDNRISSRYVRLTISNFNNGFYHNGVIDNSLVKQKIMNTDFKAPELVPTNKMKSNTVLKILPKNVTLPIYSKNKGNENIKLTIKDIGVSVAGSPKSKAAITKENGEVTIVNFPETGPNFLIGFEVDDIVGEETNTNFRINIEGKSIIIKTMPIPMNKISPDGSIDIEAVEDFVEKWNDGLEYKYDDKIHSGDYIERNPEYPDISVEYIRNRLADLDRYKEKINFQKDELGKTSPVDLPSDMNQPQRTQMKEKPPIDDGDIRKAEKKLGQPFTRDQFLKFIKGKGLISSYALDNKDAFKRWKQRNPRLASYLKKNKKAYDKYMYDIAHYETPTEVKSRQEKGMTDLYIIDDENAWNDVPDHSYTPDAKEYANVEDDVYETA
jgi:hypothetical protein